MFRSIAIVILFLLSAGLFAQKQDSVKKSPRIMREWKLSKDYSEEISVPLDTTFSLFHRYKKVEKYSVFNAGLGNYGLPFYQINFFDRVSDPDKFLYANYYPLMFVSDNAIFMNTQNPYTELDWTFGAPRERSEQTFRVRHSQNVNRFLNFGIIYDIVFSLGQYNFQRAEDKDFTLYSSYSGEKYKYYFSAGINNILSYENGGVTNMSELQTTANTRDILVNLGGASNAFSMLKNRNLLFVQKYTLSKKTTVKTDSTGIRTETSTGLSGTFSHIFTLDNNKRTYSDKYPVNSFYDTVFFRLGKSKIVPATFDSLYQGAIKNTVRFDFSTGENRKFRLGGGVGIRNEIFRYSQIVPTHDTLYYADTAKWTRISNALVGRLYNNIGSNFRWTATGELYLTGYKAGDFDVRGDIFKTFNWKRGNATWNINGEMSSRQPSFWLEQWGSNHFEWNNNLKKEFRMQAGTGFSFPARKAELGFAYAIIDNFTDLDSTAHPSQFSGGLSVASISARKEFHVWKFHLANDLLIQKSSNSKVLDLPLASVRSAAFLEHLFLFPKTGGALNTQVGAEIIYNTSYHPYSYMPATGRFYRQEVITAGNYPFINVFLNLKIKRTRLFIMFDHLNSGMMGYNYQMVPSYPMNVRMFRYGLAWTFYD